MLKQNKRNLYRHEIEKIIEERKCKTIIDFLDVLYGTYYDDYRTSLVLKEKFPDYNKRSFINRVNLLWVYPVFFILVPVRYIFFGNYQINEDSKFGKIVSFLIGDLC